MASLVEAGVGAATSLLGGILGGKGAKKAAKQQQAQIQAAMEQQQRQFDTTRSDFMPYLSGGGAALHGSEDLLGLNGNDPQAAAIAALKGSPGFTSLYDTGQDTILQNAAATGGLRGGNTQHSLAQFGSGLLATVIQNQLQNLGGLAGMGAGAAGQLGQFGQANSSAISQLLGQKGNAQASGTLGSTNAWLGALQGISGAAGGLFGGGNPFGGGVSATPFGGKGW